MPSKTLAITAYRVLLRSCKELDATVQRAGAEAVVLRLPLERDAWRKGVHRLYKTGSDYQEKALQRLFPDLPQLPSATSFTQGALKQCVRANFKAEADAEGARAGVLLDQALRAVRVLVEQRLLAECSSRAVTEGIVVEATSSYQGRIPDTLPPTGERKQRWLWSYRCRIENQSKETVKLCGRHWVVLDGCFRVHSEVPYGSKGVIGQTPIIEPGSSFEYHSGTELEASCGTMQGSFQLHKLDGDGLTAEPFDAVIRPFKLLSPEQTD